MRRRWTAAVLAASVALILAATAAGCGTEKADGDHRATASASRAPDRKGHWRFEDAARDAKGTFTDVTAPAADDIWATAHYEGDVQRLFHYDGRRWQEQDMPAELDGAIHGGRLASSGPDDVWLIGSRGHVGHQASLTVVRWDGTRWNRMPSGPAGYVQDILLFGPDDMWVMASGEVWRWHGSRWTRHTLPRDAEALDGTSGDDVWAVGFRRSGPGIDENQYSQPAAMHWDGRRWTLTEVPRFRFPDPQPPEVTAGLDHVLAHAPDDVVAYGEMTFNHGEVEDEPAIRDIVLQWDGTRWSEATGAARGCEEGGEPVPDGHGGLIHLNRWHLTADGDCRRTTYTKLPATGGIRSEARQSLWFDRIVPIPGTRRLVGAGHMQVNQSGNPMSKPLIATLEF